ncbi:hypothetical protein MKP15_01005 [Stenotrophomonas sp. Y6]|uniref:hypothetical protein n=1 Tax=Stenotrophomonas sp. Y6 TaxID=2920383 RepID=UPI001F069E2F|nr:hypothetical protein [Stenotrophomonas sp. Y6]MCH1907363.1 hypothetical protein [Stenotrophomonas sp. Y6]
MRAPACKPAATVAPGRAGDFEREEGRFNPQREHARAGFRQALKDHPQIRFNVHVDPCPWRRPPRAGTAWQAFRQHLQRWPARRAANAVARTAVRPRFRAAAGDGRHATRRTIDPAVLTAKAEAGQPAGHKPQLGMRLPPPDWLPDSYGYRFYKQFN